MAEEVRHFTSIEAARNEAIKWLELHGAVFGPHRGIQIGRLHELAGSETGVFSTSGTYWRLRIDFDPVKGPHYNATYGKGAGELNCAFTFPGSKELMVKIARARQPRG